MIVVDAATGLVLLALGLANRQRPPGVLLLAAGLAWFAGDVAVVGGLPASRAAGSAGGGLSVPPASRRRGAWALPLRRAIYVRRCPVLTASSPAAFALAAALVLSAGYGFAVATGPLRRARAAALVAATALAVALSAGPALQLAALGDGGFGSRTTC